MMRVAFAALLLTGAQSQTTSLGTLGPDVAAAAARFGTLAIAPAEPEGALRWAVWDDGRGPGQSAHLALFRAGTAAPLWAQGWPDAYAPQLRTDLNWRAADRPVAVIRVQFGAAAAELVAYALDGERPRQVARVEASDFDWRTDAAGRAVLVVLDRAPKGSGIVRRCMSWSDVRATLGPTRCPA